MKIKIQVTIQSKEQKINEEYKAIYIEQDKIIKYLEKENTKVEFDMKELILKRENNELKMLYDFKKEKGSIYIKELKKTLDVEIKHIEIKQKENQIKIQYKIEQDLFIYSIQWRNI